MAIHGCAGSNAFLRCALAGVSVGVLVYPGRVGMFWGCWCALGCADGGTLWATCGGMRTWWPSATQCWEGSLLTPRTYDTPLRSAPPMGEDRVVGEHVSLRYNTALSPPLRVQYNTVQYCKVLSPSPF